MYEKVVLSHASGLVITSICYQLLPPRPLHFLIRSTVTVGGPADVVAASRNEVYKALSNNVNSKWTRDSGPRRLNKGIATMFASAAANEYELNDNLGTISSSLPGVTLAGVSLGGLPSFIPASYVSDYMGRRFTVALGSCIMFAAAGINLALQSWNAGLAFLGALAAERYGRRPLWLLSVSGMLVSFIIVTALSASFIEKGIKAAGGATVACLFMFFGFYDIAFTPLSIAYPVEILPFHPRAKDLPVNLTTVPIALDAIEWKFYFVYIANLAAMIPIIYLPFQVTKGRTLEEIASVFDVEAAETDAFRRASVAAGKSSFINVNCEAVHYLRHDWLWISGLYCWNLGLQSMLCSRLVTQASLCGTCLRDARWPYKHL
ncbi:general substrate transporter [Teratosphaeria destructans]|uniref:General substrate transporter n=1 Tax=Teratosphaeria destructans TaxID=418781 RepID=A0A9W7W841_9PEZI|nr:general substrate transporter [Teratosphaeria destructans]